MSDPDPGGPPGCRASLNAAFAAVFILSINPSTLSGRPDSAQLAASSLQFFEIPVAPSLGDLTCGPDGNIWVAEPLNAGVNRVERAGTVTRYDIPKAPGREPFGLAWGSDGALWFTAGPRGAVGRVSADGVFLGEILLPLPLPSIGSDLARGADRALWALAYNRPDMPYLARFSPAGAIDLFPIGGGGLDSGGLISGPDGYLWFTDSSKSQLDRASLSGVIQSMALPGGTAALTTGPDGNIWVVMMASNEIARVREDGTFTGFPIPTPMSFPQAIATGPDGAVWFTESGLNKLGRLDPSTGKIVEYDVPTPNAFPQFLTACGGDLWVTEANVGKLARIVVAPLALASDVPALPRGGAAILAVLLALLGALGARGFGR
jgi:virginiamycin B lyase